MTFISPAPVPLHGHGELIQGGGRKACSKRSPSAGDKWSCVARINLRWCLSPEVAASVSSFDVGVSK